MFFLLHVEVRTVQKELCDVSEDILVVKINNDVVLIIENRIPCFYQNFI